MTNNVTCLDSVAVDPIFVDATNGDFRLARGSPIIDEGINSYIVTDTTDVNDEDGTSEVTPWDMQKLNRIIGEFVDIGAYERCVGDLDGDNSLGLVDLTIFLSSFGEDDCSGTTLARPVFFRPYSNYSRRPSVLARLALQFRLCDTR